MSSDAKSLFWILKDLLFFGIAVPKLSIFSENLLSDTFVTIMPGSGLLLNFFLKWFPTRVLPIITKAKKANASFKLREGMSVGLKVTLRKSKMYEFLDRFINIALPRVRDFRGVSDKSFDGKGNYSLGLKEQFIFPEIEYDTVDTPRGMDITIVTTAKTDDEARELLKNFNFPFVK